MVLSYTVKKEDSFDNVYSVLKKHFRVSERLQRKLKRLGLIFLNNTSCGTNNKVSAGDVVSFCLDYDEYSENIISKKVDLDIRYEDECFIVINKPAFMAIHPTTYHFDDTLSNGVQYYFNQIGLKKKIRPVNRLDRNTTGLVVFAKNEYVQELLIQQMNAGSFEKKYIGIVEGDLNKFCSQLVNSNHNDSFFVSVKKDLDGRYAGLVSAPISRKEGSIIERKVDINGYSALTYFRIIKSFDNLSLLEFSLKTR